MVIDLKQINAGDLNISYFEEGPLNGIPVILLHGFPYDIYAYENVSAILLSHGYRVIIPYLRGYGKTVFLEKETLRSGQQAALAMDLLNLIDSIQIEKAILAGYDWGGRAACIVSALFPERCLGLVSCNGYNIQDIKNATKSSTPYIEHKLWYQYFFHSERGRNSLKTNRHEFIKFLWSTWSPSWDYNEITYNLSSASFENKDFVDVVIHSYKHRFGLAHGDAKFDSVEKMLSKQPVIKVPSITIDGANDGVTGLSNPKKLKEKFLNHIKHQILPNVGHNIPQENPNEFAKAILELAI